MTQAPALKQQAFQSVSTGGVCFLNGAFQSHPSLRQFTFPPSYSSNAWQFKPACHRLGVGSPGFHKLKGSELRVNQAAGTGMQTQRGLEDKSAPRCEERRSSGRREEQTSARRARPWPLVTWLCSPTLPTYGNSCALTHELPRPGKILQDI